MVFKGYAESNKFLKSCDANKSTSYIMYLDANDLYGHSMMQHLPRGTSDWVNQKGFHLDNYSNSSPIVSFLEVDFDYPDEFHHSHNDYPLAGE